MDLNQRNAAYGIVVVCVIGIIIISVFILFVRGTTFGEQGFNELYFKDSRDLPTVIEEGEPFNFSFMVASHNKDITQYSYNVFVGDKKISSGSFILPNNSDPGSSSVKTIYYEAPPGLTPTVTLVNNSETSVSELDYNGGLEFPVSRIGQNGQEITTSSPLYYPVQLPGGGTTGILAFDPTKQETFVTKTNSKKTLGNPYSPSVDIEALETEKFFVSNVGYDISDTELKIFNDKGKISVSSKTVTHHYRYFLEKVSVELVALSSKSSDTIKKYEIHFWLLVAEKPDN